MYNIQPGRSDGDNDETEMNETNVEGRWQSDRVEKKWIKIIEENMWCKLGNVQ